MHLNKSGLYLVFLVLFSFIYAETQAQCCAQGNPAAGTSNAGIMAAGNLRFVSFYRYSYADKYYDKNILVDYNFLRKSDYHYWGNVISYGITKKITAEAELGYYFQKKQILDNEPPLILSGSGFNNAVLTVKYPALKSEIKKYEWTLGAGVKIPFTKDPAVSSNVILPVDVQPSTLAYGNVFQSYFYKGIMNDSLKLFLINRMELNYENDLLYKYGNTFSTSLFISYPVRKKLTGLIQLRHEYKEFNRNAGIELTNTGGHIAFVSPQIVYSIGKWDASVLTEIPVYRNYNGTQLGNKIAVAVSLQRSFCF